MSAKIIGQLMDATVDVVARIGELEDERDDLISRLAEMQARLAEEDTIEKLGLWTFSAGRLDLLAIDPAAIRIEDIARGLATHFRYNGQTRAPYSVAEHSWLVAEACAPEHRLQALLHDATEAYIGDIARPIKILRALAPYREVEARLEDAIFDRFGVVRTPESDAAIKLIDTRILVDELDQIIHVHDDEGESIATRVRVQYGPALGCAIECVGIDHAEAEFLAAFRKYS